MYGNCSDNFLLYAEMSAAACPLQLLGNVMLVEWSACAPTVHVVVRSLPDL
jgi:hypothetical protein